MQKIRLARSWVWVMIGLLTLSSISSLAACQGQVGPQGPQGKSGPAPTKEQLSAIIDEVVSARLQELKGPPGEKGDRGSEGPQGPPGEAGSAPTKEQISTLINEVITSRIQELKGPAGEKGAIGPAGLQGLQGGKGDPGTIVGVYEASLGALSFDTSVAGQTWLSGLALSVTLQRSAKIVVIATGDITFRAGLPFDFKIGIGTAIAAPAVQQNYQGAFGSSAVSIPLALSRSFSLGPGQYNIYLLAYNNSGAPIIKDATLTAIVIEG